MPSWRAPVRWLLTRSSSEISRSSPISITVRARWPTNSFCNPGPSPSASFASSCLTTWISSASAESPSRRGRSRSTYTLDGQVYELNLIDTPGHVDFHYEVSRSLAACEGAILLVDATQGVQAQTVANAFLAVSNNLAIVPVLNKIDMQASRPEEIKEEILTSLGIDPAEVLAISAKTGQGVPDVFRAIIERVPQPSGDPQAPLRALIFDSKFDDYQGVITYVRVVDGILRVGQTIRLMAEGRDYEVTGLGRFRPREVACDELGVGQVGYVIANIKKLSDIRIGDTITQMPRPAQVALAGLPGAGARRLLRALSRHAQPVRRLADGPSETGAERFELHLRARVFRCPRVRVSMRVPGHAAHGDRPAAARAREQPRRSCKPRPRSRTRS